MEVTRNMTHAFASEYGVVETGQHGAAEIVTQHPKILASKTRISFLGICDHGPHCEAKASFVDRITQWGQDHQKFISQKECHVHLASFVSCVLSPIARLLGAAVLLAGMGTTLAQATTYNLDLSGNVSSASNYTYESGSFRQDNWLLQLSGMQPFSAQVGDSIVASVALDERYTVNAYLYDYASFGLQLYQGGLPYVPNVWYEGNSVTTFYNQGSLVASMSVPFHAVTGNISGGPVGFYPIEEDSITFDKAIFNINITSLTDQNTNAITSLYVDTAHLVTTTAITSPVPEPSIFLLYVFGLLGIGTLRLIRFV